MGELEKTLESALFESSKNLSLYNPLFLKTFERQLIVWIGSFTLTKVGYEEIILKNKFFEILYSHIHIKECSFIIAGIMFYMDFHRESKDKTYEMEAHKRPVQVGPRALLSKSVKEGSKYLKLMSISIIRMLFIGEMTSFSR